MASADFLFIKLRLTFVRIDHGMDRSHNERLWTKARSCKLHRNRHSMSRHSSFQCSYQDDSPAVSPSKFKTDSFKLSNSTDSRLGVQNRFVRFTVSCSNEAVADKIPSQDDSKARKSLKRTRTIVQSSKDVLFVLQTSEFPKFVLFLFKF